MDRIERRIDELFDLAPAEFVKARDALARELKKKKAKAAAARVKALKRPTVAAWVLNRLARKRPELVKALVTAGAKLRKAHGAALAGRGGHALRDASARERAAIVRLLKAARDELEAAGHASTHLEAVRTTLAASASADPDLIDRWVAGRLTGELEVTGEVDAFGAGAKPRRRVRL